MIAPGPSRIRKLAEDLAGVVGGDLVSLILYGSGTGLDYVEGLSDVNFLVVVRGSSLEVFSRLRPHWPRWRKQGIAVPLVVERDFFQRAADVFPLELADLRERHEVLLGEDVLQDIVIDPNHLRRQLEFELRSKWLKLASLYVQAQDLGRAQESVLLEAAKSFCVLFRHLLRLAGATPPQTYAEVAEQMERQFALRLPATQTLLAIRQQQRRWPKEHEALLREFLQEMAQVVDVADRLVLARARSG